MLLSCGQGVSQQLPEGCRLESKCSDLCNRILVMSEPSHAYTTEVCKQNLQEVRSCAVVVGVPEIMHPCREPSAGAEI
jgi:hypothetical protein